MLALVGGGEFCATADLDRRLLAAAATDRVVVLPTGDAFEHPQRAVDRAVEWFAGLGATAVGLDVLRRTDALDAANVAAIDAANFVYLVGDSPMHLRSVMRDTPTWEALARLEERGVLAAAGSSAAAICDPMVDSRGGAFTLGLGLVGGMALITQSETWSADRLKRTLDLVKGFTAVTMPSGSALVHTPDGWETIGDLTISGGALPTRQPRPGR